MPPAIVAAGIGAAAGIGGSMLSASATKKAANQASASAAATTAENNALTREFRLDNKATLDPYIARGNPAGGNINALLGLGGDTGAANNAFRSFIDNSDYAFRAGEGTNSLYAQYGAKGALDSGAANKALERYRQNLQGGYRNDYLGFLGGQQATGLSAANALAGVGGQALNAMTQNNNSAGSAAANAALIRGTANANMYGGIASALGNAFGSSYGGTAGRPRRQARFPRQCRSAEAADRRIGGPLMVVTIDWGLLRPTDVGAQFEAGLSHGRETRRQGEMQNALAGLDFSNPESANALLPYDPGTAASFYNNASRAQERTAERATAETDKFTKLVGNLAKNSRTPEAWDASVDWLSAHGVEEAAQYKGQFSPEVRAALMAHAGVADDQQEPTSFQRDLSAAGINPRSPEGQTILRNRYAPPGFMYQAPGGPGNGAEPPAILSDDDFMDGGPSPRGSAAFP